MEWVLLGVLFFFGYPFIAALIATKATRHRIDLLERANEELRADLDAVRAKVASAEFAAARAPATPPRAAAPPEPDSAKAEAPAPAAPEPADAAPLTLEPKPVLPELPQALPPTPPALAQNVPPIPAESPPQAVPQPDAEPRVPVPPPAPQKPVPAVAAASGAPSATSVPAASPTPAPGVPRKPPPERAQDTTPAWVKAVKTWLFTGNLVAKMGLLILFIGVSFLLKYASERVTVPIELRLAGIVLADIGLLVWGWRMRLTHRGLSLPIQGAALGIMMLVTFGAFRLYHLIPSGLAFGLLFALTAFTCLLAVLQNAFWLAVFGIVGGFVSPILTSTGSGNHIALFSYYALLNAGILAIALKRSWRALNLIGFAFTFIIGTAWGMRSYVHEQHYLSTQLFLILFFVFYVAIALVWAMRQSLQVKAYVDATLVFGTPLAAFGLQVSLMKGVQFGNAFSALGFGVFYTALALSLWRRRGTDLKLLIESFLALGIVFGTLAVPFALDGRWTSAAWALEGAGVVWVGLRQRQRLTMMFGLLVQAGAWISFIGAVSGLQPEGAKQSNLWLGFLILAATAFFMATSFRAQKDEDGTQHAFPRAATWFLGLAAVWFMAGAWTEIILRNSGVAMSNMLVASGLATAALLAVISSRMQWNHARAFALVAQIVAGVTLLVVIAAQWSWSTPTENLFDNALLGALMIFGAALFSSFALWKSREDPTLAAVSRLLLAWSAAWWYGPILNAVSGWLMLKIAPPAFDDAIGPSWWSMYLVCVAVSSIGFAFVARRLQWSKLRLLSAAAWVALAPATLIILALLYGEQVLPTGMIWTGFIALWAASELMLRLWPANDWKIPVVVLKAIHLVRTGGPWIMLWKAGEIFISDWLYGAGAEARLLAEGGFQVSGSWANFVPAWAMMLVIVWLIRQSSSGRNDTQLQRWPVKPLAAWYRHVVLPLATAWSLLLAAIWNLFQDGSMAPLPYVPLLNPLDLTTAFALMLGAFCYRMLKADSAQMNSHIGTFVARIPLAGMIVAYVWFNLILLRSAAHYLDIGYQAGTLFASLFIQAMLSLVWSVTAMVIMRSATRHLSRGWWMVGAGFLALVVAKLFLVDLSGSGSVSRIVSFVGVGLLMVLIGYLAPYPSEPTAPAQPEPEFEPQQSGA